MPTIEVQVDPSEVGFDARRLARIDDHFRAYVDDGRLAGWLVLLARRGQIVHLSTYGRRDVAADLPMEVDTVFRMFSMTKPITSVAAMMLYEEGAFELKDPVSRFIPSFADARGVPGRERRAPRDRAGDRADADLAPADPHGRTHLRLPVRLAGRRALPVRRLRMGHPGRPRPGRVLRPVGLAAPPLPARDGVELLGGHRRARPGRRGGVGPDPRRVPGRAHLRPAGHGRHRVPRAGRRRRTASPPSTPRIRRPVRRSSRTPSGPAPSRRLRRCPAAVAWSGRRRTTTGSSRCSGAAASSTACDCSAPGRSTT